jgi:hypothetical protein
MMPRYRKHCRIFLMVAQDWASKMYQLGLKNGGIGKWTGQFSAFITSPGPPPGGVLSWIGFAADSE